MGGFGSGRRGGRATVEGCRSLKLDVNRVTREARQQLREVPEGAKLEAAPIMWTWTAHDEAKPRARVLVVLRLDHWRGEARLQFDVDHYSRRTGPQDQVVQMETTPCRFGGRRWWWLCPATWRRCSTLYLPNGGTRFLSRGIGAYRLAYASQNGGPLDRSHGRLARLHRKMGGTYGHCDDPPPRRPKWMRRRTYDRLVAEWEGQMERHEEIWMEGAAKILARSRY
jgi:hypothetical protein